MLAQLCGYRASCIDNSFAYSRLLESIASHRQHDAQVHLMCMTLFIKQIIVMDSQLPAFSIQELSQGAVQRRTKDILPIQPDKYSESPFEEIRDRMSTRLQVRQSAMLKSRLGQLDKQIEQKSRLEQEQSKQGESLQAKYKTVQLKNQIKAKKKIAQHLRKKHQQISIPTQLSAISQMGKVAQQISETVSVLNAYPAEVERLKDAANAVQQQVRIEQRKKQKLKIEREIYRQSYYRQEVRMQQLEKLTRQNPLPQKLLDQQRQLLQKKKKQAEQQQQQLRQSSTKIEQLSRLNKYLTDEVQEYRVRHEMLQEKLFDLSNTLDSERQLRVDLQSTSNQHSGELQNRLAELEITKQRMIDLIGQLNTQKSQSQSQINALISKANAMQSEKLQLVNHLNQINALLMDKSAQTLLIRQQLQNVMAQVRAKAIQRVKNNRIHASYSESFIPKKKKRQIEKTVSAHIKPTRPKLTFQKLQPIQIRQQQYTTDNIYADTQAQRIQNDTALQALSQPQTLIQYGNSSVVLNFKSGFMYIGLWIDEGNGSTFCTRNFIKIRPRFLTNIIAAYNELEGRPVGPEDKYSRIIDPSTHAFLLKDRYQGNVYYSLRHKVYYRGQLYATRNGFNLRQDQMAELIDYLLQ